ncbi:hypothetical protein DL89DRAFT_270565 [Linderina pennispora]|uniref:Uncharacterized protein n=1 Tax=Linderina pennispora TaxID=61395 RepID=A0A1Y1VYF0_9FUNG|nr:uncharacterized protein DL89DRAFT_270565 [Linderina pennispora]ORX65844.1 hypothetical protein DL89DRAFT_270565 [Linderina pennispora]
MSFSAQNTPIAIINRILDYVVQQFPKTPYITYGCCCGPYARLFTVAGLCRHWREVAISRLFEEVWWCSKDDDDSGFWNMCRRQPDPRSLVAAYKTGNLFRVKTVRIHWIGEDIVDGAATEVFKTSPFDTLVVPSTTTLVFSLMHSHATNGVQKSGLDATIHAEAFCNEIHRIFPNSQICGLSSLGSLNDYVDTPFVRSLISGLTSRATAVSTTLWSIPAYSYPLTSVANLFELDIDISGPDSPLIEVIRRNASALEHVGLKSQHAAVFSKIVQADDGTPIVYPRVMALTIACGDRAGQLENAALGSPTGAPFPALQKLTCTADYPFSNDVLFRENSSTLECLKISLCPRAATDLRGCGVFDAGRFPALKYVNSYIDTRYQEDERTDQARCLLVLSTNARILFTNGGSCLFDNIGLTIGQVGRNIVQLQIPSVKFTLHRYLQLVKALPYLREISAGIKVTSELLGNDRAHDDCIAQCRRQWEIERDIHVGIEGNLADETGAEKEASISTSENENDDYSMYGEEADDEYHYWCWSNCKNLYRTLMLGHLDTLYADLEFVDALYDQYYPLSTTLTLLDISIQKRVRLIPLRLAIIIVALCPTVQCIQTSWVVDEGFALHYAPDLNDWVIARSDVEATTQHTRLKNHLQSLERA